MSAQAQYDIRSARVKTSYAKVIPHFCNKGQICSVLLLWSEISIQTDAAFWSEEKKKFFHFNGRKLLHRNSLVALPMLPNNLLPTLPVKLVSKYASPDQSWTVQCPIPWSRLIPMVTIFSSLWSNC